MSLDSTKINTLCEKYLDEFIAIREHIHAHPELSFQEYETAKFISKKLPSFQSGLCGSNHRKQR